MTGMKTGGHDPQDNVSMTALVHVDHPLLAMGAGAVAYFMFAVMNALAKLLSEHHHLFEIAFYRNLVAVLPFLILIFAFGKHEILRLRSNGRALVIRSVLGTVSLVVTFAAYAVMPMADTTAFLFTSSLIVPAFAFFFLGEKVGYFRWSIIVIGFIGVLVMLGPKGELNLLGVSLALGAAATQAVMLTILRGLGKTERPVTVTFYFLLIGAFLTALPMPFVFTVPTWDGLLLLLAIGICGLLAQLCITVAHRYAPANIVAVFNYSGIIWATALGWFIWNDWPATYIWVGGSIVIVASFLMIWREARLAARRRAS